jgi:hypothetical protein
MQLHWLPVKYRSHFKLLLYVFKSLHGKAPTYLEELIVPYTPGRSLRSENEGLLHQPRDFRTKAYGERRFDQAGATLWNDLPIHLRKEQSLPLFWKGLKTDIFLDKHTVMFNGSVMTLVFLSNWWCDCHISVLFMLYLCTIFVIYYFVFHVDAFYLVNYFLLAIFTIYLQNLWHFHWFLLLSSFISSFS